MLSVLASGEHEIVNELPMAPILFGVVAFAILITLLLVTYAFRSVGSRVGRAEEAQDAAHGGSHGSGHGH
ncbi:hypothetical protein [Pseudokineococcus sp. 1T1Z-3]|uniref:hypothetical protein n=1 Tax=Pseudokineococcus sp. 1T1Z-3 TaxID=3132745 RepID=UPI0030A886B3